MIVNVLREVDKLKAEIAAAKTEKSEAQGAKKSILESMKQTYGVKDLEGAKSKLSNVAKEMRRIEEQIEIKFTNLQENYSWEE